MENGFVGPTLSASQINDDFYLDVKLGTHNKIKEQVDEKMKIVETKSMNIEDFIENHYPNQVEPRPCYDIWGPHVFSGSDFDFGSSFF